ncbi:MAG: thioredoxin [Clostridiales bacterium]|nr:thioredoxin [Clostridiales bacterium]
MFLQILLIAVGALAIAAGIWRDEVRTVFMKATYICLECIGIG